MPIKTYVKNRDQQLPQNPSPVALLFKEKSSLANHPLSCHPQRGVWQPRKWKKNRENEAEEEKWENSRPVLYIPTKRKTKIVLQDFI